MVPRAVVLGIDKTERAISLIAGAIALVLSLIISPHLFKNTNVIDKLSPTKQHTCLAGYHLVNSMCERTRLTHPSDWLPQFLEILLIGLAIVAFAWWRKRAGVAASALFLGLALGTVGLPFLFLGGWLIIRALRLQKYGDASFRGSSAQAREMAQAKRAGRATRVKGEPASSSTRSAAAPAPAPSKRYTPKQRSRKR
jgi:hypothetical protein